MRSIRGMGAAALVSSAILGVSAGDLDPPGAPGSTPGAEPRIAINQENTPGDAFSFFTITHPGSYYLTEHIRNLQPFSVRNGIVVEARNVTIDLNGFTLDGLDFVIGPLGAQGPSRPTTGILASGTVGDITVLNGFVQEWGEVGIDLEMCTGVVIDGVSVRSNGSVGIRCGDDSTVRGCGVTDNGGTGIDVGFGCVVSDCLSSGNGGSGIVLANRSVIAGCVSRSNGFAGINALVTTITQCGAHDNGGDGFFLSNSTVIGCAAVGNAGDGLVTQGGSVIRDCTFSFNGFNGDGAGIRAFNSGGNRIEDNTVRENDRGIEVTSSDNLIVGNLAVDNTTNYAIGGTNAVGPILAGSDPITSTNPWANFEF